MKLRNKKTGEIKSIEEIIRDAFLSNELDSLKSIDTNWEDVDGTNDTNIPLIKDEKTRKAVRAWAEAIKAKSAFVEKPSFERADLILTANFETISFSIDKPKELKFCEIYTIAELCGEDEA